VTPLILAAFTTAGRGERPAAPSQQGADLSSDYAMAAGEVAAFADGALIDLDSQARCGLDAA
jgi:hypothetical protein